MSTAGHPITPYGTAIHKAIAEGDLSHMKALLAEAEKLLAQQGDLTAAIERLKQEIHRLEKK